MIQRGKYLLVAVILLSCVSALRLDSEAHQSDSIPAVPYDSSANSQQVSLPNPAYSGSNNGQSGDSTNNNSGSNNGNDASSQPQGHHAGPAIPHNPSGNQNGPLPTNDNQNNGQNNGQSGDSEASGHHYGPAIPHTPHGANAFPAKPYPVKCQEGEHVNNKTLECECPKEKPARDENGNCTECKDNKQWNETKHECVCKEGYQPDSNGTCHKCDHTWDLTHNRCVSCPEGFTFSQELSSCSCPQDKPYLDNNTKCIACDTIWNYENKTCLQCKNNKTWNNASRSCVCQGDFRTGQDGECVKCPEPNFWEETNKTCIRCPTGFKYDQNTQKCACPQDKPYLTEDKACVSCDTKWNQTNNSCIVCKLGTLWNTTTQNCTQGCLYPLVDGKCKCPETAPILNEETQKCKPCDQSKPIWNGQECKACPEGTNYVLSINHCVKCVEGTTFNEKEQRCKPSSA